jgi:predicted heme/steroid binding protein
MQTPKKGTIKKNIVKKGPNQYAKEQVLDTSGKNKKAYVASNTGMVYKVSDNNMLSMDTTGYSKGKPTYTVKSLKDKDKTIKRKEVLPLTNKWKNIKKKGGTIRTKKK